MKLEKLRRSSFAFAIATAIAAVVFMFVAGPAMASPDQPLTKIEAKELSGFLANAGVSKDVIGDVLANSDANELLSDLTNASASDQTSIIEKFVNDEVYDNDNDKDDDSNDADENDSDDDESGDDDGGSED